MDELDPLLERATRGEAAALQHVLDHWMPQVRRWAIHAAGDPVLAEEGVQEALLRVTRGIRAYDLERPFAPWLKTVVFNACRTERARDAARHARLAPETDTASPAPEPGRALDLRRAHAQTLHAFAALSPRQREILDLVDLQGHAPTEVAEQLGLTPGAVRGQLHQARRAVRAHLVAPDIVRLLKEA